MTTDLPHICAWAQGDPLMQAYHDREWGVPVRDPRLLWEMLMLEGFQAGLSWRTILHRREGFRRAFDGFDPAIIASYGADKVEALMQDAGIIRARAKIEATISNARVYLGMISKGEDCQSASKRDPLSACKRGPPGGVALGLMPGADFALGLA